MKSKAIQSLNVIDNHLDRLLVYIGEDYENWIDQRPESDKWSVLEIIQHLYWAELKSYTYIRKKLKGDPKSFRKIKLSTRLRTKLAILILKSPFKFKIPKVMEMTDQDRIPMLELIGRYKELRRDMRVLLESLPEEMFEVEIFLHPIFGRISLTGMVEFMDSHFTRHEKQLLNAMSSV